MWGKFLFQHIFPAATFFLALFTLAAQAQEDLKVAVFDPAGSVEKSLLEIVREDLLSKISIFAVGNSLRFDFLDDTPETVIEVDDAGMAKHIDIGDAD